MTVLQLKAQQDALQKAATTRDPIKALAEFVWNALDADATEVNVEFDRNALGGIEGVAIRDNGKGITSERANTDFENWGASWKRSRSRTDLNRAIHGKEGQGRLRFYSLADRARWTSKYTRHLCGVFLPRRRSAEPVARLRRCRTRRVRRLQSEPAPKGVGCKQGGSLSSDLLRCHRQVENA